MVLSNASEEEPSGQQPLPRPLGKWSQVVIVNLVWKLAEQSSATLIALIVSILLARFLGPSEFGVVAMALVITNVLSVVVEGGLGSALIQKEGLDELDLDTVFWINLVISTVLYAAVFFAAGGIASIFHEPALVPVIRWLGLVLFFGALRTVQQAQISRRLQFRRFFVATLAGTVAGGSIGVFGALSHWGVWALVAQQLTTQGLSCGVLWMMTRWHPRLRFSWSRSRGLFSFGSRMLVASLLDSVYNNLRQIVIGWMYSPTDVAYFNRGKSFPYDIVINVNRSIDSVLFPVLARSQGTPDRIKAMVQKSIRVSSFIMWPLMMGLAVVAEPLVRVLLTEKWLPCVPILQLCCVAYAFYPVQTANLNAIKALGQSRIYLRLELLKKAVGVTLLIICAPFGIIAIVGGLVLGSLLSTVINSYPNRRLLGYTYWQQIRDMFPSLVFASITVIVVQPVLLLNLPDVAVIVLQLGLGCITYLLMSRIARLESFYIVRDTIKHLIYSKKRRPNQ